MQLEKEFQKALILHQNGNIDQAKTKYEKIIKNNKEHFNAIHMLGVVAYQKKNLDLAENLIQKAIKLNNTVPSFYNNLGNVYKDLKKFNQAIDCYKKVYQIDKNHFGSLHNLGIAYGNLQNFDKALSYYNQALKINPKNLDSYINRANIFSNLKRFYEAYLEYNKALQLEQNEKIYCERGTLFTNWGRYGQAIEDFNKSISINKNYAPTYENRGVCFYKMKRFEEALKDFETVVLINNDYASVIDKIWSTKARICDWNNYDFLKNNILDLSNNSKTIAPFITLGLFDDPKLHYKIANNFVKTTFSNYLSSSTLKMKSNNKINVGYYSADFNYHPVSFLSHEIFKNHDKDKFNIFAFDLKGKLDETHDEIKKSFKNNFYYVDKMKDFEVCDLSRKLNIDIAIDLSGHTDGARTNIFNVRCAPIQVNYLGFPGTSGANFFDYILADENLILEDQFEYYNEKVVYLPNCYQSNESFNQNLDSKYTKEHFKINENQFVYCCFNNSWKITPNIFDVWMEVLKAVDHSVLWLLDNNKSVKNNLIREASQRGIGEERLIFSKFVPRPEHLKRQKLADLFLDTFPYSAHTTCSDALRSGVPVLTLVGKSFQSRVSSSVLKSCSLEKWVTYNIENYKQIAVHTGKKRDSHQMIKLEVLNKASKSNLFNSKLFTSNLEQAYKKMIDRFKSNLPPNHIVIKSI